MTRLADLAFGLLVLHQGFFEISLLGANGLDESIKVSSRDYRAYSHDEWGCSDA